MKIIGSDKSLRSPEFHLKKERERRLRLIVWSILILLILIAPIVALHAKRFLISHIEVKGNNVTSSEEVQQIVAKDLSGNYWHIIPHASSFFYSKSLIVRDLMHDIPRLSSVTISRVDLRSIAITVTERQPVALYCKDVSNIDLPTGCYFVDKEGLIFSEAPSFSGGVYVAYTTNPVFNTPLGQSLMSADEFGRVTNFLGDLSLIHLVLKVLLVKSDEYNLFLRSGTDVMWKRTDDTKNVESNLVSFINDDSIFDKDHNMSDLLYIDLRFGNKVFYKFKGE